MKNLSINKVLILSMLLSFNAIKAEVKLEDKIKTVNLRTLVTESVPGKEAVASLTKMQTNYEAEFKQMMAEMKQIEDELVKMRSLGSEKKIRDLEERKMELQAKAQRLMQNAQTDMQQEEMRLMQPLFAEQVEVISAWAKTKDLYMVIDESSGRVVYKKDGLDATNEVMKLVNQKHEQKTALAKNKAAAPKAPTKVS